MRIFLTLYFFVSIATFVFAQSPQTMSYQAIVRNNQNVLVSNKPVGMKVSILQGSSTGTPVYSEIHSANTNINGLISIEIGGGSVNSGNFSLINWGNGPYFIKTEIDPTGGANYTITSVNQILAVPYSYFSEKSRDVNRAKTLLYLKF
jgi:hypothetical protein